MNTRILYITGDENADNVFQSATENGKISREQLWEESFEAQEMLTYEDGDDEFEYGAFKFGTIDPSFIDFVKETFINNSIYVHNFYVLGKDSTMKE